MAGGTAVAERPPKAASAAPPTQEEVAAAPADASAGSKYLAESLTILVIGASGDLAKKLTAPALYELYQRDYLPKQMTIVGYARSKKTDEELRDAWRPVLVKKHKGEEDRIDAFLSTVIYRRGQYDSAEDVKGVFDEMEEREQADGQEVANRLFYFAVPPSVFADIGSAIKEGALSKTGWNRLVVEKPFGKDTASFEELSKTINGLFTPDQTYFVDHYLGKVRGHCYRGGGGGGGLSRAGQLAVAPLVGALAGPRHSRSAVREWVVRRCADCVRVRY